MELSSSERHRAVRRPHLYSVGIINRIIRSAIGYSACEQHWHQ
jgi:hypothetical protein